MKRINLIIISIIVVILLGSLIIGDKLRVNGKATSNQNKNINVAKNDPKQEPEVHDFLISKGIIPKEKVKFYKLGAKFIKEWAFVDVIEIDENSVYQGIRPLVLKKEKNKWIIFDGYNKHGRWERTNEMPKEIKNAFNIWDGEHY